MSVKENLDRLYKDLLVSKESLTSDLQRRDIEGTLEIIELSSLPPLQVFVEIATVVEKAGEHIPADRHKEYLLRIRSLCLEKALSLIADVAKEAIVNERFPDARTTLLHELWSRCQSLYARLELINPSGKDRFQAALWEMIEQGTKEDLAILQQVRKHPPYISPEIDRCFREAERRIGERIAATAQPDVTQAGPRVDLNRPVSEAPTLELTEEVRTIISQLRAPNGYERVELTAKLGQLGVDARRSSCPRGSHEAAAPSRLSESDMSILVRLLDDPNSEVRSQAALALGEWGGEAAAKAVANLLKTDLDGDVHSYCITALALIGGPIATETLQWAAHNGASRAVQEGSLSALEELKSGAVLDLSEAPMGLVQPGCKRVGQAADSPMVPKRKST